MDMKKKLSIHHYSLAMLLSLYLAQGLPVGFMTQALPTLLRHYGVSLTQIGVSGLLMLPWAIKFLWAPCVDRYGWHRLGHYRSWIILTQISTVFCLLILAFLPVENLGDLSALWGLFAVLLLMNFLCATQDIATDGLAVNLLKNGAVHWGNTFQVMGSRLGFILGGGAVLYSIDLLSWKITFLALAVGVGLNSVMILFYSEPKFAHGLERPVDADNIKKNLKKAYGYLWVNKELRLWLLVVATYKIADGFAGPILKPMMVDAGLSLTQIGLYVTMFGAGCAVIGALSAGWLIKYFSLQRMFIVFSIFQTLTLIYYVVLAELYERNISFDAYHFYIANAIEELFAAMTLVAMLSLIMKHARSEFAGTDFTVQVALMTIVGGGLYTLSGIMADYIGYSLVLYTAIFSAFVGLFVRIYWAYMKKIY